MGHLRDESLQLCCCWDVRSQAQEDKTARAAQVPSWVPSLASCPGHNCAAQFSSSRPQPASLPFHGTSVSPELPRPRGPVPTGPGAVAVRPCPPPAVSALPGTLPPIGLGAAPRPRLAYLRPSALRELQSANENRRMVVRVSHPWGLEVKSPVRAGFLPGRRGWLFLPAPLPPSEILTALGRPVAPCAVSASVVAPWT